MKRIMTATSTAIKEISIAHSPDSDDAFMFYGLATNKVRVPGYKFTHTLTDIETLNHRAINEAFYDVTAISFHAYPYLQHTHPLLPHAHAFPRSLGAAVPLTTTNALRDSIQHALDNRDEALAYAMQFARDLDPTLANRFVGMYVNERTLNYGEDGRVAIKKLLDLGFERGIIPIQANVDFVG